MIRLACAAACAMFASFATAQDIHKCMTPTGVAYQGAPCEAAQAELAVPTVLAATHAREDAVTTPAPAAPATAAAPRPTARWTPYRLASIAVGMSDDQVLNLPGWGRPARIARSRDRTGWRETWTYDRADGERALSFLNGRLATIDEWPQTSPATQIASAGAGER